MQIKNLDSEHVLTLLRRFNDVHFAGQVLFVVIVLLVSWSGIKTIQTNYGLQKQIAELNQQNSLHKLENSNLALQNEYFKSRQYLELAARQNFGLAMPGEKEVIVPPSVALKYTADLPEEKQLQYETEHKPNAIEKRFTKWIDFFLHRSKAD
jgi:cell division protein FtsL